MLQNLFKAFFSWIQRNLFVCIGVLILWIAAPYIAKILVLFLYVFNKNNFNIDELGQFGDIYGMYASLFAIGALIFTLRTYNQQKKDLEEERIERNTFNLLNMHNELVKSLTYYHVREIPPTYAGAFPTREVVTDYGKLAISKHVNDLKEMFAKSSIYDLTKEDDILKIYYHAYQNNEASLGHYFRSLYHIILYIDNSPISENHKKTLIKIVRSQLSVNELILLFFNGISKYGVSKNNDKYFKHLIEKYALLEDIPEPIFKTGSDKVLNPRLFYLASAFSD